MLVCFRRRTDVRVLCFWLLVAFIAPSITAETVDDRIVTPGDSSMKSKKNFCDRDHDKNDHEKEEEKCGVSPVLLLKRVVKRKSKEKFKMSMRGVVLRGFGGTDVLHYTNTLVKPLLGASNNVLLKVKATAVNRADIMQRKGNYPPPPGAPDTLGLEASGVIEEVGTDVKHWKPGDEVMCLLGGGGYAEYVSVHAGHCMKKPSGFSWEEAAAVTEVFLTSYQALKFQSRFKPGMNVVAHAGASGVGTALCQLTQFLGGTAITTSSEDKVKDCLKYANFAVSRTPDEETGKIFAPKVNKAIGANSVDIIVDPVFGGGYLAEDAEILRKDGNIVVLAFMGGNTLNNFSATPLFQKRASIKFSTLRSQSDEYKADLVSGFVLDGCLSGFEGKKLMPVIDSVLPLSKVVEAHAIVESNKTFGKVILTIDDEVTEEKK